VELRVITKNEDLEKLLKDVPLKISLGQVLDAAVAQTIICNIAHEDADKKCALAPIVNRQVSQ